MDPVSGGTTKAQVAHDADVDGRGPQPATGLGRLTRPARHYAPVLAGVAVFVLVVTLTPTAEAPTASVSGSAGAPVSNPLTTLPAAYQPGASGMAVSGVRCGPGVRQVPWSHYAPECQPRWHGANGGATAPGVTARTITLTFRYAATPAEAALFASFAPETVGTEAEAVRAMQGYVSLLNRTYELYGRHVVLKVFNGKGDVLPEASGGGQAAAEADAATAKSLGAFADVSLLFSTSVYDQALARQKVVAIGGAFESTQELQQYAPYQFTPGPDCDKASSEGAAIIGRAMVGLPAIYAGDPAMHPRTRVFGFMVPDNPLYAACTTALQDALQQRYHTRFAVVFRYGLDLTSASNSGQYTNAIAQFKAAGVTTIICGCDPVTPLFLTQDANAEDYHPEWFSLGFGDAFSRLPATDQWSHDISGGVANLPRAAEESYHAFRLAYPTGDIPPSYEAIYAPLMFLFDALQAAGPDLTAQNLERGLWSLPRSAPGGEYGVWRFGPGTVDPSSSFQILWWDPTGVSVQDGKAGTYQPCNDGAGYLAGTDFAALPDHQQLRCFDRRATVGSPTGPSP
jgi:hypothetical protein